ncbi:MAG: transcriptional regulator [Zetaproteobacteria bacterium CG12_big_fil_rev_8_21_14_0_65_55_1124]|nr:MAG: transcriptional regulator [Zetaproteobacteria bacterium CG1_02_55_237]PIS18869.1 MAG: transcriptional regulator [Zetaproteobacteria bacterium CG08_land_8_20_14_0_20_55_17]PIW43998.1 MAG: transcriptional regulator [Zetaproteobacteria bacterium CG12_big_fil_rev_8_21_14_0_65_55_1124]PIY51501.1 MAG: transcriptional regulator [Zetaproteobacteria bacterium CG_4_10_14_0_8_um_filter_55_43]PIZ40199.1 MAG: transcriptional regulator [Zetaproteobacteria bacterium CG_4_10_14_0_2_um_filter_55_20]PJB
MSKQTKPGRLPSLNALRAFAVAGRHANLRDAAEELFVTASALSHQIRGLEERLGVRLFIRSQQGLQLSEAGRSIHPQVEAAFSQLSDTLASLKPAGRSQILTVSMLSTFAMRWFIPRLYRFQQQHPDIEVRISTSIELVDFDRDDMDCAIRSGQGKWTGTKALRLFEERFSPVCSPTLATADKPLHEPADLMHHTLLHSKMRPHDWRMWLSAEGLPDFRASHELEFETRNFAIAGAIRGLGVAIIDPLLVQEELKDGRLIQPFSHSLPASSAYHLVWPDWREETPKLSAFREWLLSETKEQ